MDDPYTADELTNLRKFVEKLEAGVLAIRRDNIDVTKQQIRILKREIEFLEGILARRKADVAA